MQFLVCVGASEFFLFYDPLPTDSHCMFRHIGTADTA